MTAGTTAKLADAITAAGFPPASFDHVLYRVEQALVVYRGFDKASGFDPRHAPVSRVGRGRPRDERLESLLLNLAVQFHAEMPERPGVTKRGKLYSGELVEFARHVLDAAGIHFTGDLGSLIYRTIRKEAQVHGDLHRYPPLTKRSRADWRLPSDVALPDDPLELMRLYGARRRSK